MEEIGSRWKALLFGAGNSWKINSLESINAENEDCWVLFKLDSGEEGTCIG